MSFYTWATFKAAVKELLPVDATRENVGVVSSGTSYVDRMIRLAVRDLQHYVIGLRVGHETTYHDDDVTEVNYASLGELPEECQPRQAQIIDVEDSCIRKPLIAWPWDNHEDLICGEIKITACQLLISIDPYGRQFYVYPKLDDTSAMLLSWDGVKVDFDDGDDVPFDEDTASAAAAFVKFKIEREVNRDINIASEWQKDYFGQRQKLYVNFIERRRIRDANDSPQPKKIQDPCAACAAGNAWI